jgi:hypothetical protein
MAGSDSHAPVGSVDRTVLVSIKQRLDTAAYVRATTLSLKRGKPTLTATFVREYFPPAVEAAYYDVRWYTSGDFEIHYRENWTDGRGWQRRWDRHPREGPREHYHPPPDAGHPPEPAEYPANYYEVLRRVDQETLAHVRAHPLVDGE